VSCHRLPAEAGDREPDGVQVPVGAGVAGQQLLVVTARGRSAGVGQRGEVVVRGRYLAVGYAGGQGPMDRFGEDPEPGVRTFRTGDYGRYGTDGLVRLDGRADRQVSIGGYRLELGEIEATALRHPLVRQAVAWLADHEIGPVLALQVSASGPLDADQLRAFLRALLPGPAVPVSVQVVGDVALGTNGKAMAAHQPSQDSSREAAVEPTPAEPTDPMPAPRRALAAMENSIRDVIGRPIGPDENFFDAGLTSLALVQLHLVSTRELTDPFPVTAMFAYPNLRALRRYLVDGESPASAVATHAVDGARLRRIADARRELRKRIRIESERP
jgi:hypothetical protein